MVKRCSQTKPGWYCTRDAEHSGPCCPGAYMVDGNVDVEVVVPWQGRLFFWLPR